jgi:hypothetical protein
VERIDFAIYNVIIHVRRSLKITIARKIKVLQSLLIQGRPKIGAQQPPKYTFLREGLETQAQQEVIEKR